MKYLLFKNIDRGYKKNQIYAYENVLTKKYKGKIMATISAYMTGLYISKYATQRDGNSFEYRDSITNGSANTGNAVIIPQNAKVAKATIAPATGSGKIQGCINLVADIIANPDACTWVDLTATVSAVTNIDVTGYSAVRQVNVSGTTAFYVRTA